MVENRGLHQHNRPDRVAAKAAIHKDCRTIVEIAPSIARIWPYQMCAPAADLQSRVQIAAAL